LELRWINYVHGTRVVNSVSSLALGKSTPKAQRLPFFLAALASVGYIVGVALTHSPSWGLL
jgi:hypothetical protein